MLPMVKRRITNAVADFLQAKITDIDLRVNHYFASKPVWPRLMNRGDVMLQTLSARASQKRAQVEATTKKEKFLASQGKPVTRQPTLTVKLVQRVLIHQSVLKEKLKKKVTIDLPEEEYAREPQYVSTPTQQFVSTPQQFVSTPTQQFVSTPTQQFVSAPTQQFVSTPTPQFAAGPRQFVSTPATYTQPSYGDTIVVPPGSASQYVTESVPPTTTYTEPSYVSPVTGYEAPLVSSRLPPTPSTSIPLQEKVVPIVETRPFRSAEQVVKQVV
jgi:hypothetical protein